MNQNRFWNLLAKKLSGEASPDELAELEKLMKDHPDWIFAAEHIEDLWKLQTVPTDPHEAELAFDLHFKNITKDAGAFYSYSPVHARKKTALGKFLLIPVSLLLLLAALIFWKYFSLRPAVVAEKNISEVSTRPGSRSKLVLPDSTVVWLNSGSTLTYNEDFAVTNRNITLSGEAFFEVRKATIPFIIHAHKLRIKVTGTTFNVKSYPNEKTTETSLLHGSVEVTIDRRPGEKYILKPNEKLVVANEDDITRQTAAQNKEALVAVKSLSVTTDSTIIETSWVDNKLVFQDESFQDLARRMERWFNVSIEFKNEKVSSQHISGTFTTETVQEALEELQITTAFHYQIKSNSIVITQ
jgi:transmembrane sensor